MSQSFIVDADQWIENGYAYHDGLVFSYETDRKEQTYMEFGSKTLADFLADEELPADVRNWAQALQSG